MTNQTAATILKNLEQSLDDYCELNDEGKEAFHMAITALELFGNSEQLQNCKTGKWTKAYDGNDDHVKCTGCFKTYDWTSQAQYFNFCPNCGVDMRGEEHDRQM